MSSFSNLTQELRQRRIATLWRPLIIYLSVYATDSDKMVEIRIRGGGGGTANLSEIERLKGLLDRGVITPEEFEEQKRRLL